MTAVSTAPRREVPSRWNVRRVLGIIGVLILIFVAIIEIMPFVLTIANSFKCDPAVTDRPGAFIPVPPFGVQCETRDPQGNVVSRLNADQQVNGITFNPSYNGYETILRY